MLSFGELPKDWSISRIEKLENITKNYNRKLSAPHIWQNNLKDMPKVIGIEKGRLGPIMMSL